MEAKLVKALQGPPDGGFEMVRLSKSKAAVDVSPNTIRSYSQSGLPLYKLGKAIFFSRSELIAFIRARGSIGPRNKSIALKA